MNADQVITLVVEAGLLGMFLGAIVSKIARGVERFERRILPFDYHTGGIVEVAEYAPAILAPSESYLPHSFRERLGPTLRELMEDHPSEMVPFVASLHVDAPKTLAQAALNDLVKDSLMKARVYPKVPL